MIEDLILSDVCAVVPRIQLRRSIVARMEKIEWRIKLHKKHKLPYEETQAEVELLKLKGMVARLDKNPLIEQPPGVRREFGELGTLSEQSIRLFGHDWRPTRPRSGFVNRMVDIAREATAAGRASEMAARIELEISEKIKSNWYTIMNTLTVRADQMKNVFYEKNNTWKRYLRMITYDVARAEYGSVKRWRKSGAKTTDIHTYCAVVERGDKAGRLHIHVVHCIKKMPGGSSDPNKGQNRAVKREINSFRKYWNSGFCTPVACRFHGNDPFARLGWCWPLEYRDGAYWPIEPKPPVAVANYMADYLTKSYQDKEKIAWRTKTSREYGKKILKTAINAMRTETLLNYMIKISESDPLPRIGRRKMSCQMLRRLSLKELLRRGNSTSKPWRNYMKQLEKIPPRMNLLEKLEMMQKGDMMEEYGEQKITCTKIEKLMSMAISDAKECTEIVFAEYDINKSMILTSGASDV